MHHDGQIDSQILSSVDAVASPTSAAGSTAPLGGQVVLSCCACCTTDQPGQS